MGKTTFFYLYFNSEKISYSNKRLSFGVVGVKHQNRAIDIRTVFKSYDFSIHGRGEIFLFRLYLGKIQLLERKDEYCGLAGRTLKSRDRFSWST